MVHKITKSKYVEFGNKGYASFDGTIARLNLKMKDGRTVSLFVNRENNLLVGDVIDKNEKGGYEFLRRTLETVPSSGVK